ncbi:MAG: thioredoxin family protein [Gammaproteobacteria bacterium]|nr:thioredoxin family protein [Gammaproteobacteria bacterium]MCB1923657.1 thioredoxin family protein [Gammaproteobacteria bacterium]
MMLVKPLSAILLLVVVWTSAVAAESRDPGQYFFNETFGNFREELQTARAEGKQGILLMFEMDECPFCHYMKTRILNQPEVQDYFREHFLIFPVDIEGDIEITDFNGKTTSMKDFALQQYRVRATPVFAFFDLDGNYIKQARLTGKANNKEEFLLLGRYVVERAYENEPFTRFKRAQR